MRPIILATLVLPLALASCGEMDSTPAPLTEKQTALLAKELDGKVAGNPQNCISTFNADNTIRVSDDILLYRVSGNLVYKNNLRSSCPGLARDNDIIVTEQFGSQKCRGDLVRLVDRTSGIPGPVCSLGEFVPYRKDSSAG
ncbi:MAG TPA: DUF6491 family protein [Sphingorhabdus sp.]|jgi:hypothetical protein|nr:DUF6491 family protein [Sphingorhabdus sp.]